MDLVADSLFNHLQITQGSKWQITQLRPRMRRYFSRFPLFAENQSLFNAERSLNRYWYYPSWIKRQAKTFDIFHLVDHSYSHLVHQLPADRTIITCHDLDTFRCLLEPEQEPRPIWFKIMTKCTLSGFRKVARVICDSPTTYEQVLRWGLLSPERVRMIPLGVHPSCLPKGDLIADAQVARLLGVNEEIPLLLHVGSTIPRKRIDTLLHVLSKVKQLFPAMRLVRVGGPFTPEQQELVSKLKLKDSVIILPFLERDILAAVYRRATLVLQPSEREGFGLPVVEAMACGTPVLASDIAVLREVGGHAAAYCPVGDFAAWSKQVTMLLTERQTSPEAWSRRKAMSINQAARFSWMEYVRQVAKIYNELLP